MEELLAPTGVVVSYEAIRLWCGQFGPEFAGRLRLQRRRFDQPWFVDEVFIRMHGTIHYPGVLWIKTAWVIDILVQARRDWAAADCFFRHLINSARTTPHTVTTDRLRSHSA